MTTLTSWLLYKNKHNGDDNEPDGAIAVASNMSGSDPIKTHFLFTAKFFLNTAGNTLDIGDADMAAITLDLKSATRPNVTVQQEDINFYGYRAKVGTKTVFGVVELTFYDDGLNKSHDILWAYLNSISPLTNIGTQPTSAQTNLNLSAGQGGLPASQVSTAPSDIQKSTFGVLPNSAQDGIFSKIEVYHYYQRTEGRGRTTYTYYNPKLESAKYTELDMGSNEPSTISMTFTVEGMTAGHEVLPFLE